MKLPTPCTGTAFCATALVSLILISQPAPACQCQTSFSACNEVGASNLVFIGKVESIQQVFLSRWNLTNRASLASLNDAYDDALEHPSAAALTRLKAAYLKALPGLPASEKARLDAARTIPELESLFNSAVDRGMRVRFSVKTLFRHEDDDDDDVPKKGAGKDSKKDDDDDKKPPTIGGPGKAVKPAAPEKGDDDFFEISTPFGDCGYDFQAGETYLVYANNEEASDYYFTGSCTRTRRLSEAGEDLAYLFFYKNQREESARLEGFVTTDVSNQLDFDRLHDPETIKAPVPGAVVELRSDSITRFAESDRNGRSVFDGLPEGDYRVSAFAAGFPFHSRLLAGPQPLHVAKQGCERQFIVAPKPDGAVAK